MIEKRGMADLQLIEQRERKRRETWMVEKRGMADLQLIEQEETKEKGNMDDRKGLHKFFIFHHRRAYTIVFIEIMNVD
ncbi:hypothetical protein LQZ18_01055 [Lachnospiraceae bacterium ZAX-1]